MKRILLFAAAFLISAAPVFAQSSKVDKDAFEKRSAKSDADIENPKKNIKSGVWLDRGKLFYDAAVAPDKDVFKGIDFNSPITVQILGKGKEGKKTIGDVEYEIRIYDAFDAYLKDGKIFTWEATIEVFPNALEKSYDAYAKAYDVDSKSASKVKAGIISIADAYKQKAENLFALQKYGESGDAFHKAFEVQLHPAVNVIDTASVYNAGFLNTFAHKFDKALEDLKVALKYNYDNDGDVYYYMFHCYYNLDDMANAKKILLDGIAKYPGNTKIVEGLLGIYTTTEGDPKEIIPIVEKSIADDPTNIELWGGLGRIYDKLGDEDKSIEAFSKAAELAPEDFNANFNLGFLYIKKGDAMSKALNEAPSTGQAAYNEQLEKINTVYAQSVSWLEKAYELNPSSTVTVELLKNVFFRLRDEAGMMDKYNKYNEIFKQMEK